MEALTKLAPMTRLSAGVVRVLGQNPGNFTLQGTNTYILGQSPPFTLLDTGEGNAEYIPVLEQALKELSPEPVVSDIIISHWHHDHVGGIPSVLALLKRLWVDAKGDSTPYPPPRLHKFPLPDDREESRKLSSLIDSIPADLYTLSAAGKPFHDLSHGQTLSLSPKTITVLHTPGHTLDSIVLYLPSDRALYTADSVLGQGTAVFEDLSSYISSLRRMLSDPLLPADAYNKLYPGHGPVVEPGRPLIEEYIRHRLEREQQILEALKIAGVAGDGDGKGKTPSTWTLVSKIYASYPESLWLPAARSVDHHLQKLLQDDVVEKVDGEGVETRWAVKALL